MKKVLLTLIIFLSVFAMYGQGKYGADSAECIKYLSFYQQYMKEKNINDAARNWRQAIKVCPPTANQNMLLDGMKIMRIEIGINKNNPVRRKELIDTLMMLHQIRIESYPTYIVPTKVNKAMDMINYVERGDEMEVYEAIEDAMNTAKMKSPVSIVVRYMQFAIDLFKHGQLVEDDVMKAFEVSTSILEQIAKSKPSDMVTNAIVDVETMFAQSGVANCDNLIAVFEPRYNANPEDKALLSTIVKLFSATECTDSDLFLHAVERLHQSEPSCNSAYLLYQLYSKDLDRADKAIDYMKEAIDYPESDDEADAQYYLELANYHFQKLRKNADAVAAAKCCAALSKVLAAKAYFLIGTIWSGTKCEGNDIEKRAPFWVATDYMLKAKKLDPNLTEEVNKNIAQYSKYYPLQSDAFMYDLVDGDSYSINCNGMSETTMVRTQK